jgi:hypothetical protein
MAVEFIDCSSLSINYDVTGKVTASFTVVKDDSGPPVWSTYKSPTWGGETFDLVIMGATRKYVQGSNGWYDWSMQTEGVVP